MSLSSPSRFRSVYRAGALLIAFASTQLLPANPNGGAVIAGSATIQNSPGSVVINQHSSAAIINWQSFSIGAGETTRFLQPGSQSAALNRVLGGGASTIYGSLFSNGQVYLINQNGILIGPGGVVNVAGGFTASTRDLSNEDFLNGKESFIGHQKTGVKNLGEINSLLGNVVLIGKTVRNNGKITANHGSADLVAGDSVLLGQRDGIGNTVTVNPSPLAKSDLNKIGVDNTGKISAAAVQLRAANGNIYALAINNGGSIRSTSVSREGGHIWLTSRSGAIANTGLLNASSKKNTGVGGTLVLKSSGTVTDSGTILARGGLDGSGGHADVSGAKLNFTGSVNFTAPDGKFGGLVLDPATLNVITTGTGTIISGQNDSLSTTISPATVQTALMTGNVTLNANTNITISNAITLSGYSTILTLSTNTSGSTITINAPISIGGLQIDTAGAGDVITPNSSAAINVTSFYLQNGFWNQNALGGTLAGFSATGFLPLGGEFLRFQNGNGTSGNPYLVADTYGLQGIGSPNNALLGTSSTPIYYKQTTNLTTPTSSWGTGSGFASIGTLSNPFYGTYDGNGFTISSLVAVQSTGTYYGIFGDVGNGTFKNLGLVSNNISGQSYVGGLVGIGTVTITNCYTTGNVSGAGQKIGGLVGDAAAGSSITNCYNTGTVNGSFTSSIGGLVGTNYGAVTNCYNTGNISGTGSSSETGGLIGENDGTLTQCYSTGNVSGSNDVGGLAGNSSGTISLSYATGMVSGASACGGLVGQTATSSSITNCYATGSVSTTSGLGGGLVGDNVGTTLQTCYSSGSVGGGGTMLGGLIGSDSNGAIKDCYYSVAGSGQGMGLNTTSGTAITYNGSSTPSVTGLTAVQVTDQSLFDSAWDFTLGSGVWGINGFSNSGQINSGQVFLQDQFTGVAKVVPNAQATTYNRTSMGTGFSTTAYTTTGTLSETAPPVLTLTGSNINVGSSNNLTITSVSPSVGYAIEVPPVTAMETFSPKSITVSAISPSSVTYGNSPAFSNNGSSQVISGDTLGGTTTYPNTDALSPAGFLNAGTFSFTPNIVGYNSNYSITAFNSASFTVAPKGITVSATSIPAVTYGSTPAFANDGGGGGVLSGDTLGGTTSYTNSSGTSSAGFINAGSGSYIPSITGANPNYTLSFAEAGFTVNRKSITVSGNNLSSVYGTTPPYSNNGQSLVFTGDTLGGTATYSTTDGISPAGFPNAGTASYTPSISGYNSNYNIVGYTAATLTVTPKTIAVVSATALGSIPYGTTPPFANDGESQVLSGDTLGGTVSYTNTGTLSPAGAINVGSYSYTPSISGYNSNYNITAFNSASFSVVPLSIIVSATSGVTATYGNDPAFAHNGETQVLSGDTLGGTTTFSTTDAISPAGYLNAGTYSYTPTITGYNSNYAISSYNPANFTVNPLPLTVSANPVSAVYGTTPAYSNDGEAQVFSGDTLGGTPSYTTAAGISPAGFPNVGRASYTPTLSGYNPNYTITAYNSAPLTITPKPITVSGVDLSSIPYGTTPSFANDGESQVLSGDTLGGTAAYTNTGTLSRAGAIDVGSYNYTPSISGYNPNYSIVNYNSGAFSVLPLSIIVSATSGVTATYGSDPAFAQDGEAQVLSGDRLGGTTTYSNTDALSPAGFLNAGNYTYTPSITGYNPNYSINAYNSASFTINPLPIAASARPVSATYGTTPAFSDDGNAQVLSGDFLGGSVTYSNTDTLSSGGYLNGGTYTYTPAFTGVNPNYTVTAAPAHFTINPAPLTVTVPAGQSVVYGTPTSTGNSGFTYTTSGLLPGDSVGAIGVSGYSLGQTVTGGPYAFTPATLTNSNYYLLLNAATFSVTPKPVTVSAIDLTASPTTYGNGVPFANDGAAGQLVGADTLGGTTTYTTTDLPSPAGFLNAGTYSYSVSIARTNPNYAVSFQPSSFTINPKAITLTANPGQSITYGTDTATGNASLTFSASGLLPNDALPGTLGGYSSSETVAGSPYAITQGTLGNPNYLISRFNASSFQINPATLDYVANPANGFFGLPFPQFSGTVTGFVNGDPLANSTSGVLTFQTTATSASPQGLFAINGSGLTAANYTFTQDPGNAHAFSLFLPATIVSFETSSISPTASTTTPGQFNQGDLSTFGGDYLEGTRRERDRSTDTQSQSGGIISSNDPITTEPVTDQNGKSAGGFYIKDGVSGFDRQTKTPVSPVISARLQRSLNPSVRDTLTAAMGSKASKSETASAPKTTVGSTKEIITDKAGKPTGNFNVLPGGTFGFGSQPLPPFIQHRIEAQLQGDVRDQLSKSR